MLLERATKPGRIAPVLAALGGEIVAGGFAPGARLPAEPELEARFGVSRSVIREAVKILVAKGLVDVGPRLGTRVRPRESWSILDREVLTWMTASGRIDGEFARHIDELREIIEPAASALAAERACGGDLDAIRLALAAMERAALTGDIKEAIRADRAFHSAILSATKNPVLRGFGAAIDSILGVLFHKAVNHLDDFRLNLANHDAVLKAIAERRPERAAAAMREVIGFTRENMRKNDLYQTTTTGGDRS